MEIRAELVPSERMMWTVKCHSYTWKLPYISLLLQNPPNTHWFTSPSLTLRPKCFTTSSHNRHQRWQHPGKFNDSSGPTVSHKVLIDNIQTSLDSLISFHSIVLSLNLWFLRMSNPWYLAGVVNAIDDQLQSYMNIFGVQKLFNERPMATSGEPPYRKESWTPRWYANSISIPSKATCLRDVEISSN